MSRFQTTLLILIAVAVLWLAQEVFVPLVLAGLLAMLLSGPVQRLEKRRVPRVVAVTAMVLLAFGVILGIGWLVGLQIVTLAKELPQYQQEITEKYRSLSGSGGGTVGQLQHAIKEMEKVAAAPTTAPSTRPASTQPGTTRPASGPAAATAVPGDAAGSDAAAGNGSAGGDGVLPAGEPTKELVRAVTPPAAQTAAAAVADQGKSPAEAADAHAPTGSKDKPFFTIPLAAEQSPLSTLASYLGLALGPLGTAGIVVVFVFFMLLEREDLRDRMIRLVSQGRYTVTTTAVDDGITRIVAFLRAQAIVNGTYGAAIALGLWGIGAALGQGKTFPSFLLWGLLAAVLRFIPYVGPWIAAAFPLALSLAVYHGFTVFVAVLVMFAVIELLSNNVMEPMLYGATTGLSTMAILVSAVFWTWLWGPIGLLLATPLTVVMMVLGRHVPPLKFLEVLLGDRPAMTPAERVYQRLLAGDEDEAFDVAAARMAESGLLATYDDVVLAALAMSENDTSEGLLDEARELGVRQGMRRLIDALGQQDAEAAAKIAAAKAPAADPAAGGSMAGGPGCDPPTAADGGPAPATAAGCPVRVAVLPAHDEGDELAGLMLSHVLRRDGCQVLNVSHNALAAEVVDTVAAFDPHAVLISATPPAAVSHVRYLLRRLSGKLAADRLAIGVWTARTDVKVLKDRLGLATANTTLAVNLREADANLRRLTEGVRTTAATGG
jgi:predicted PurR-regulated permease PerM/methylmalonyl-CoA mutase cobalamin-binding subunit